MFCALAYNGILLRRRRLSECVTLSSFRFNLPQPVRFVLKACYAHSLHFFFFFLTGAKRKRNGRIISHGPTLRSQLLLWAPRSVSPVKNSSATFAYASAIAARLPNVFSLLISQPLACRSERGGDKVIGNKRETQANEFSGYLSIFDVLERLNGIKESAIFICKNIYWPWKVNIDFYFFYQLKIERRRSIFLSWWKRQNVSNKLMHEILRWSKPSYHQILVCKWKYTFW